MRRLNVFATGRERETIQRLLREANSPPAFQRCASTLDIDVESQDPFSRREAQETLSHVIDQFAVAHGLPAPSSWHYGVDTDTGEFISGQPAAGGFSAEATGTVFSLALDMAGRVLGALGSTLAPGERGLS